MSDKEKLLSGVRKLEEIVGLTLGPRGRNVVLQRDGWPLITNDGITIAREVKLDDPVENLGAKIMLQASSQTNVRVGDGTTSSIVLGREILERSLESGRCPVMLKDELLGLVKDVSEIIGEMSTPLSAERIEAIAINSCASVELGAMVARAYEMVGLDGVVSLEENNHGHTTLSHVDGCEIPATLASPYMIENPSSLETTYVGARLAIHDGPIKNINDLRPLLELAVTQKFPLVIIADDFSAEVIQALLLNRVRGGMQVLALKLDEHPTRRTATLGDLAALTNATLISREFDRTLASVSLEQLGTCQKLTASMNSTKLITSFSCPDRADIIRAQINEAQSDFEKSILQKRLARLTTGIAVLGIGGATDIELKERKLRAEDAIAAVKAAALEGIVVGGGVAYLRIADKIENDILKQSLTAIIKKILTNAGLEPDEVISKIKQNKNPNFGFDARELTYGDLMEKNIIDPAAVVREVITNALSVAATLLTTEAVVV